MNIKWLAYILLLPSASVASGSKTIYCGADIQPFVSCQYGKFAGYERAVIQTIEGGGGLLDGIDYDFQCFETFEGMFNATKNCSCDAMIGHITPTVRRKVVDGLQFAQPHLATSLATVVQRGSSKNMFSFLHPFETTLWVTILSIPFVYAFTFAFANLCNRWINKQFVFTPPGRDASVFVSEFLHTIFGGGNLRELSTNDFIGKVLFNVNILTFSFFFLFITSVYTANLANLIISSSAAINIDDIAALTSRPNLKILANEIYTDFLRNQYNIDAEPWTWLKNSSSVLDAVDKVGNGQYDALVSDRGALLWAIRQRNKCDTTLLPGSDLSYFSVSTAFSPCTGPEKVDAFSTRLLQAQDNGNIDRIGRTAIGSLYYTAAGVADYDTYLNPACQESDQIGLDDISGLLILISAPLALILLLPFLKKLAIVARRVEIPK